MFQSTPAIADGRTSGRLCCVRWVSCFNPRPPSLTGEQRQVDLAILIQEFQSTPAIADGRTLRT